MYWNIQRTHLQRRQLMQLPLTFRPWTQYLGSVATIHLRKWGQTRKYNFFKMHHKRVEATSVPQNINNFNFSIPLWKQWKKRQKYHMPIFDTLWVHHRNLYLLEYILEHHSKCGCRYRTDSTLTKIHPKELCYLTIQGRILWRYSRIHRHNILWWIIHFLLVLVSCFTEYDKQLVLKTIIPIFKKIALYNRSCLNQLLKVGFRHVKLKYSYIVYPLT